MGKTSSAGTLVRNARAGLSNDRAKCGHARVTARTTDRSRRLAQEARNEFERAGYRLGTAQADVSIAHVEHRLMNFHSSEAGAFEALQTFVPTRSAELNDLLADVVGIGVGLVAAAVATSLMRR